MPSPTEPSADDIALFTGGSRTVAQAYRESGVSKQKLWELMGAGLVRYRIRDERGTRLVAWLDVVKYVASLPTESPEPAARNSIGGRINRRTKAGTGART